MTKGILLIISGPSGSGKGTITKRLESDPNITISVSATTRAPRKGEMDGVQYHFISKECFLNHIKNNNMLEYNEYCGNYYGTPSKGIEDLLASGQNVILEIDVNGAKQVCQRIDAVKIFVVPPCAHILKKRLSERGTESPEAIQKRLEQARREIKQAKEYDYVVVNDQLEDAVEKIHAIISAEQSKAKYFNTMIKEFLNDEQAVYE